MDAVAARSLFDSEQYHLRFTPRDYQQSRGKLAVKGLIALPIIANGSHRIGLGTGVADIEMKAIGGKLYGFLCLCKSLGHVDIGRITDAQYAAYVAEVPKEQYGLPYRFEHDYVVLKKANYQSYVSEYMQSSPLWGGFVHLDGTIMIPSPCVCIPNELVMVPGIQVPTAFHSESVVRSVLEPFAFERFLKLYHLFELQFDLEVVDRIRGLGDDLFGIATILNQYRRTDCERLKSLIQEKCDDIAGIQQALNGILADQSLWDKGKEIFFAFGKEDNPFKDDARKAKFYSMMDRGGFSLDNARACNLASGEREFAAMVQNVATYWIYRVRCCIAHNRIGEYVMTAQYEGFVTTFAEPLLRVLLLQAFRV